jgi:hypothetical protein
MSLEGTVAGTAGSGGHNRLSVAAHRVRGTLRPGRHAGASDLSEAGQKRLKDLGAMYSITVNRWQYLRAVLDEIDATNAKNEHATDITPYLRELRRLADQALRLNHALEHGERLIPPVEASPGKWDSVDLNPLRKYVP